MNRLSCTRPLESVLPVLPVLPALALGLVLAALSLPAIAKAPPTPPPTQAPTSPPTQAPTRPPTPPPPPPIPAPAPPPVDLSRVLGSPCARGQQCQSGHCWQAVGDDGKTCQGTEMALSAMVVMKCPESAEVIGSWDSWPDGRFSAWPREWPMTVKRWAGPGSVPTQTEGTAVSRGEMRGRALAEKWTGGFEGVAVTGYDGESDAYSSVVMSAASGCVVLSGAEDDDGVVFSGDNVSRRLGYDGQRIELTSAGASGTERVEIAYGLKIDDVVMRLMQAPPPVDDKLVDGSDCSRGSQCQSGHCWAAENDEKKCHATAQPAG